MQQKKFNSRQNLCSNSSERKQTHAPSAPLATLRKSGEGRGPAPDATRGPGPDRRRARARARALSTRECSASQSMRASHQEHVMFEIDNSPSSTLYRIISNVSKIALEKLGLKFKMPRPLMTTRLYIANVTFATLQTMRFWVFS